MKKIKNGNCITEPDVETFYLISENPKLMKLKSLIFILLLTLYGASAFAQPNCPDSGWENEPIQDPESCCILFEMLPSTLDFPWNFWIVTADGVNYSNADNPINFPICFEETGVENVVITYFDALGATLCENNWSVVVENGCGPPCEDCIDFEEITINSGAACDYEFTMEYTIDPSCEEITIISETWDFDHPLGTGSGINVSNTFPEDGIYLVTGTIEYTVDWDEEPCTQKQAIEVTVTGCTESGEIDCSLLKSIEILADEITMGLPMSDPCEDPTYIISISEFGSGDPFELATVTTDEVTAGVFEATISDLDPCTPYQIQVELFCGGIYAGTCVNEEAWITECPAPCDGCINLDGIDIVAKDGCEYTFDADFEITDACGDVTINAINWNFGFDGPGSSATGEIVDASFLCAGTYRVTATILYSTFPDVECIARVSRLVEVTGCDEECSSCYLDECVAAYDLLILDGGGLGCSYTFLFYYSDGKCGDIDPESILINWDFGYPDGTGTSTIDATSHFFPSNGTYIITIIFNYRLIGEIEDRSCTMSVELEITDCLLGHGDKMVESPGNDFSNSPFTTTTAPNPADENVTITIFDPTNTSDLDQLQLVIHDINGRVMYRGITNLGIQKMIDVSDFEHGLYFYEILDGDALITRKKLLIK